jgi:signal transduction histidine kinase
MKVAEDIHRRPVRPGGGLRIVLLLGFGGLLALLVFGGLEALATLHRLHTNEQAARQDFMFRDHCLLEFRSTLDQYGNRIDQYFLDTRPDLQYTAATDFASLARRIHACLNTYPTERRPQEEQFLDAVRNMLAEQEKTLNRALAEDRHDEPEKIRGLLYGEAMPRNRRLIEETERIELWNHSRMDAAGATELESFSGLQTHLTRLLLIVLSSGIALSIGSIVYILQQDREARRRYAELMDNREELSRLPSSLLDAQEEERRSISRELHDEVGQSLGALLVDLGRLKAAIPAENTAAQEQFARIKSTAETAVSSVRNIALLLRPPMLDDLGLLAAIEWQGREVSRRTEMEVEVESSGVSEKLAEEYKICIYRVTQEALNNAARHSGGHRAWVRIEQTADHIAVTVRDDGQGFDPGKTRGLGLLGMEERVRRLGGKLEIKSNIGAGTVLRAMLPLAGRN